MWAGSWVAHGLGQAFNGILVWAAGPAPPQTAGAGRVIWHRLFVVLTKQQISLQWPRFPKATPPKRGQWDAGGHYTKLEAKEQ